MGYQVCHFQWPLQALQRVRFNRYLFPPRRFSIGLWRELPVTGRKNRKTARARLHTGRRHSSHRPHRSAVDHPSAAVNSTAHLARCRLPESTRGSLSPRAHAAAFLPSARAEPFSLATAPAAPISTCAWHDRAGLTRPPALPPRAQGADGRPAGGGRAAGER